MCKCTNNSDNRSTNVVRKVTRADATRVDATTGTVVEPDDASRPVAYVTVLTLITPDTQQVDDSYRRYSVPTGPVLVVPVTSASGDGVTIAIAPD